jgi:hypothetical protein
MIAIRFDSDDIEMMVPTPGWHRLLPRSIRLAVHKQAKIALLKSIRGKYRNKSLPLEVMG